MDYFVVYLGVALLLQHFVLVNCTAGSCDSDQGTCIDVNSQVCDGILKTGYCPGPSNIVCCEPMATLPDRCNGSGPALLNSSYLFTLQNQGFCFSTSFFTVLLIVHPIKGFSGHPGALVYIPSNFDYSVVNLVSKCCC
jgi:hypothetical protein